MINKRILNHESLIHDLLVIMLQEAYYYIYASIQSHEKISIRYYFYLFFFVCATNTKATPTWEKLDGDHR